MKRFIFLITTLCCLLFCFSCAPEENNTSAMSNTSINSATDETNAASQTDTTEALSSTEVVDDTIVTPSLEVICWVENLNIRDRPNIEGKLLARAVENQVLTLTGNKTDHTETIDLRGKSYNEPWVEIEMPDGTTAWIFAGAVKRHGEEKGNAINTLRRFTLPHFGTYDLSKWKYMGRTSEEAGDASMKTTTYKKGSQILKIVTTDMGEYGWNRMYRLTDRNNKILKERSIYYTTDINTMTETVKDFTNNKQYVRSNELIKRWWFNRKKPVTSSGDWSISSLATEK